MGAFENLLSMRPDLDPGGQQRHAHEALRAVVSRSNVHYWEAGDPVADHGRRVLIGIGVYVPGDLRLLDRLDQLLGSQRNYDDHRVDVFSIFDVQEAFEFEGMFPGIGNPIGVPIVGVWEDGQLEEAAWGWSGREILLRVFPELTGAVE